MQGKLLLLIDYKCQFAAGHLVLNSYIGLVKQYKGRKYKKEGFSKINILRLPN